MIRRSPLVVIGIPTFQRPTGIRRLLDSLSMQMATFPLHIVIADNEGETGSGTKAAIERRDGGFPFPMTVVAVPERGISQARNALLKVGFDALKADALVMVDDDVRVEPNWVATLVAMQRNTGADVVGARVLPDFIEPEPNWANGQSVYWNAEPAPGRCREIHYTTSTLISAAAYQRFNKPQFDPAFSISGGGDYEYFRRLRRRGAVFAFAPDATSYEMVGPSRATRIWALKRAFRNANCHVRILRLHSPSPREWAIEIAKVPIGIGVSFLAMILFFWSPVQRMKAALLFARQLGKLANFMGYRPKAYHVIHGS